MSAYTQQSRHIFLVLFFSFFLFFPFFVTHAQFSGATQGSVELLTNPLFPKPYSVTEVTLNDAGVDTLGSEIRWYVNNVEFPEYKNERVAQVRVGALGKETIVKVVLTKKNSFSSQSSVLTIIPRSLDVIIESESYVPLFYAGKALPSSDTRLRIVAILNDAPGLNTRGYSYKWTLNDEVLLGGAVRDKNTLDIDMPHYDGNEFTVEVFDTRGVRIASESFIISGYDPELHFYENSVLRGLIQKTLTSPHYLIGDETTIFGEPYFINAATKDTISFEWELGNILVPQSVSNKNSITVAKEGGEGQSLLELKATTDKKFPKRVADMLQLIFE